MRSNECQERHDRLRTLEVHRVGSPTLADASLDVEANRWSLVFNRTHSMLDSKDIIDRARGALKAPVIGTISEDPAAREASDRGRLIWDMAPNSRFAKDMRPMITEVERLREQSQPEQSRRSRSKKHAPHILHSSRTR